jgi:predicted RNA-binding Zn-ribbon protein involved in translation (DUF1610 family)
VPAVEKGTKLVCPKCKTVIGEFKRAMRGGEVIRAEDVNFFVGDFKDGDEMVCPRCGFPYSVTIELGALVHTEKGWLPIPVPTEVLMPTIKRYLREREKRIQPT